MSDYTRIISRLKKSKIKYKESKPRKDLRSVANTTIEFGAVKMWISPSGLICGITIFDIRLDGGWTINDWRTKNDIDEILTYSFGKETNCPLCHGSGYYRFSTFCGNSTTIQKCQCGA